MSANRQPDDDTSFAGGAFAPSLPGGRASGDVRVTTQGVLFASAAGHIILPFAGLEIRIGGASDRTIFFSHPEQPQATIFTDQHDLLHHCALAGHPSVQHTVRAMGRRRRVAFTLVIGLLLVLIAVPVGLFLAKDRLVRSAVRAIPAAWEVNFGETLFEQIRARGKLIESPELQKQLEALTHPLVENLGATNFPMKFHILEDPTLNAFALPGGHVVLHSGLLLAADQPEEVAGVLAHEIAHAMLRHGFQSILSSVGMAVLVQFVVGDVGGALAIIGNHSAFMLNQKFSRDFEREADELGWEYLRRARIDPRGLAVFLRKLQAQEAEMLRKTGLSKAAGALTLLSTHPATAERIATLEAKSTNPPNSEISRDFAPNYRAFQDALRSHLQTPPVNAGSHGKGKR